MELRSGKTTDKSEGEERSETGSSETMCLMEMLREMERKNEEKERRREEKERRREEKERRREEKERKRDEENKKLFETLMIQNQEIKKKLEERFKDMEIFKKAVEARVVQTEKQGEETKKVIRRKQEKYEYRCKLLWEEMNRVQEDS